MLTLTQAEELHRKGGYLGTLYRARDTHVSQSKDAPCWVLQSSRYNAIVVYDEDETSTPVNVNNHEGRFAYVEQVEKKRAMFLALDKEPIRKVIRDLMTIVLADEMTTASTEGLLDRVAALSPEQQHVLTCFFDFGLGHATQVAMRQGLRTTPWGVMVLADMLDIQSERARVAREMVYAAGDLRDGKGPRL